MYDAAIAALGYTILCAGGWIEKGAAGMRRIAICLCGLLLTALCFAPRIAVGFAVISPAALLLTVRTLLTNRTRHIPRLLFSAVVSGLAGWQLCEWFPMGRFEALPMLLPAVLYAAILGTDDGFRRLLPVLAAQVFLLCRFWMDRFLFGYAVLEIGNDSAVLGVLCVQVLFELLRSAAVFVRRLQPQIVGFFQTFGKRILKI